MLKKTCYILSALGLGLSVSCATHPSPDIRVAAGLADAKFKSAQAALNSGSNRLQLFGMTQPDIARLEEAGVIRSQAEIRAPIGGTVIERGVTLGETANPEQSHLFVVADLRQLWLLVEVSSAQAAKLKAGQSVTLTDPATGRIATSALDYVSPIASAGARTIRARAVVDNSDGSWRPGMFVTAKLPTRAEAARSIAVPAKAVQDIGGQPVGFVPVPGEAYTFEAREVAVGPEIDGWRPVKSGLEAGESLVFQGGFLLKAELGKAMAGHDHSHQREARMIERILKYSVERRHWVVALTIVAALFGEWSLSQLPIDAASDITNKQMQINVEHQTFSTTDIERLVTLKNP